MGLVHDSVARHSTPYTVLYSPISHTLDIYCSSANRRMPRHDIILDNLRVATEKGHHTERDYVLRTSSMFSVQIEIFINSPSKPSKTSITSHF